MLMTSDNKPSTTVLLVQKEVAERLASKPGDMSILAVSAQVFADVYLGDIVSAKLFTPPPKVDSRVVVLKARKTPFFTDINEADFFRIVKAGFSAKRKKLRSSLAGGLQKPKAEIERLLQSADISADARAEDLTIAQWLTLLQECDIMKR
jgi:16S rRNA (adenine1518-N6/adenine1519-N6)-dimethyltransferase